MRINHGTRVTTLMVLVLALTMLCGFGALLTALEMERLMGAMVSKNLPSMAAANELQKTLLQQRGIVAAYFLDGHPGWLNDLDRVKPSVAHWMAEARSTAHTEEERNILDLLAGTYTAYDAERERAIALFAAGRTVDARNVLLRDVSLMANQAEDLCRQLVEANQRYVRSALEDGHRRVERLKLLLMIGIATSVVLGLALLLLVLRDVLRPVRRLAEDAKALTAEPSSATPPQFLDELGELEFYSRALMSDMSRTRTSLEESRIRLLTAEKLAAVGKFAACVAHEIRSPLTSMRMWLYQLQQTASGHPETEQSCRVLATELSRLEDMATSFLEFSRPPVLDLAPSDMSAIVDGTLELAGPRLRERGLRTVRVNGTVLPKVLADSHQLRQVLLNLVANAAEATPEGGELRISETVEANGDARPEVVVRVEDGGPGVPAQVLAHLFEPFVTTKPHGTGLGLCIASSIVLQHGGRLVLESSSERGAVFALRVPVGEG